MAKFNISVVSDTVCPWCFVGKRRLEAAIASFRQRHPDTGSDDFAVEWKPFQLQPDAPRDGMDKREFYRLRFGEQNAARMHARLQAASAGDGIRFSAAGRTGNTRDSHRVIALAGRRSAAVQSAVVEQLFRAYFERDGDITSHADLRAAAVAGGLDGADVDRVLGSDECGRDVDQAIRDAQMDGVSGVPRFVINDAFELSGAQSADAIVELLESIEAKEAARRVSNGSTC